tara:strand:+ start:5983 stop:6366 length:384 start_codon:yes stop_codon:yes gene_type:complete
MSTLKLDTILHSSGSTTTEPSIPALDQRMAKAWVNFSAGGTVNGSFNVSSVTDEGSANYTANLATAMPNEDFVCVGSTQFANRDTTVHVYGRATAAYRTTTSQRVRITTNGSATDPVDDVQLIIFSS